MSDVVSRDIVGEKVRADLDLFPESRALDLEIWNPDENASARLYFNNIGKGPPVEFIGSLDVQYVVSKVLGNATQTPDLMATIARLHTFMNDPDEDGLTPQLRDSIEDLAREVMAGYDPLPAPQAPSSPRDWWGSP